MPSGKDFMRSIAVIVSAAAIVALGAQELYQRHRAGSRASTRGTEGLVRELAGSDVRAQMSPQAAEDAAARREEASAKRTTDASADQLSDEDKGELTSLLDGLLK